MTAAEIRPNADVRAGMRAAIAAERAVWMTTGRGSVERGPHDPFTRPGMEAIALADLDGAAGETAEVYGGLAGEVARRYRAPR